MPALTFREATSLAWEALRKAIEGMDPNSDDYQQIEMLNLETNLPDELSTLICHVKPTAPTIDNLAPAGWRDLANFYLEAMQDTCERLPHSTDDDYNDAVDEWLTTLEEAIDHAISLSYPGA